MIIEVLPAINAWVFWISSFLVIYPYIVYPAILILLNRFLVRTSYTANSIQLEDVPKVTMIVSAFNESRTIAQKLENALLTQYPKELFEVIVVSDGSTDGTDQIVNEFVNKHSFISLIRIAEQSGKTIGLNKAVPEATGEIIIFSDANAIYQPDAVQNLVSAFKNPDVGYAVGSALYHDEDVEAVNISEGLYWKYELWIKALESSYFSVVGGDGAIYAIRKQLFKELSAIDISDFVNPLQIVAAGYKGLFLRNARSFEGGASNFGEEFKRKRRIVNRSWGAVVRHMSIFNVRSHGRFLFMLFSHKILRWYSGLFVFLALFSSLMLGLKSSSTFYSFMCLAIFLTIAIASVGWLLDKLGHGMPKLVYLFYYFYLVTLASTLGIYDVAKGTSYATWSHGRNSGARNK